MEPKLLTLEKQILGYSRKDGWLDSPGRTNEEIDKWLPKYIALFDEWKALERMINLEKIR